MWHKLSVLALLVSIAGIFSIAGCGNANKSGKKYRIAVIPKGTSHKFWKSVHAGALKAAKELGDVEIIWKGPQKEQDTGLQIEVVKSFITKRVHGICLAPNQATGLVDAVLEANEENIPVVIFDSGLAEGAEYVSYVATDNYRGGQLAADGLAKALGGKGDVIMLRYRTGSESTAQREQGFLDQLKKKHPGIKVLSSNVYAGATAATAMEKATILLNNHTKGKDEDVDGIFAVCEPNCNGTLEALEETGLAGKVKFMAFDPSEVLIQGLKDGKVHGIVLQDPIEMGYQSVMAMHKKLSGKEVKKRIPTGEYVATLENMKTEKFSRLLNPVMAEE